MTPFNRRLANWKQGFSHLPKSLLRPNFYRSEVFFKYLPWNLFHYSVPWQFNLFNFFGGRSEKIWYGNNCVIIFTSQHKHNSPTHSSSGGSLGILLLWISNLILLLSWVVLGWLLFLFLPNAHSFIFIFPLPSPPSPTVSSSIVIKCPPLGGL